VLYDKPGAAAYLGWLHRLSVRYVVLTNAPPDYSARAEATLVSGPRSPLRPVFRDARITIYEVPHPRSIIQGPGSARVLALTQSRLVVRLGRAGTYRIGLRYSPYWEPSAGCLFKGGEGLLRLGARTPGTVVLSFRVDAERALRAVAGGNARVCAG
jgi:hypothetical protein